MTKKVTDLKADDVIVIGHEASETLHVQRVKPLEIAWDGDTIVPKPGTAYDVEGYIEDGRSRTVTLQSDDEVEVQ